MIHSKKYSSYYSLSLMVKDNYSAGGDSIGRIGPSTTQISSQKFDFGTYRHDGVCWSSKHYHTESPVKLYWSRDYTVGYYGGYSFVVSSIYVKCVVGTRTTHHYS